MLSHIHQSPELFDKATAELHTIAAKMPTAAIAAEMPDKGTARDRLNDALKHLSGAGLEGR
jgi:hypothetical protein